MKTLLYQALECTNENGVYDLIIYKNYEVGSRFCYEIYFPAYGKLNQTCTLYKHFRNILLFWLHIAFIDNPISPMKKIKAGARRVESKIFYVIELETKISAENE